MTAYVVFGGADFGAGFWDLVAGGPERGSDQRELIQDVIGPVWETNHVWLIFVIVVMWTAFPEAFAAVASTMYIPLTGAAVGIILRGSGFAFRKAVEDVEGVPTQRLFGAVFASSSVLTPFFLGTVAGGVASGRVPLGAAAGEATLRATLVVLAVGALLLIPSLIWLYVLFQRHPSHAETDDDVPQLSTDQR